MSHYRPPYREALAAGLGVLALYVLTLAPSTAMWDASEYITTAHILGIPHPPGNPLFVVLGKTWSTLLAPTGLPVAVRINLLAALTSALAATFYFLVAHRILWGALGSGPAGTGPSREGSDEGAGPTGDSRIPLVGAALALLLSATAFTVWHQSTVNEKVYTVSVAVIAAVVWLVLRWRDLRDEPRGLKYLLTAVYLMALGSTNHLMSILPLPALGVFLLVVSPGVLLKKKLWVRAIPLVVLGLSLNFFLPIRAARNPVINEGDPTCGNLAEAAVAIYSNGQAGCDNLARVLSRHQYQKPPVWERQAPFGDQLLNYFQYFDWQWARGLDPSEQPGGRRLPVTALFLVLGLWGLWLAWKGDRQAFYLLGVLTLTFTLALVFYLNFKYGYSLAPEVQESSRHEVRERDYFFIASFGLWGMLAGMGLTALWTRLAHSFRHPRRYLLAAPVLIVAFFPLVSNWSWASRSGDYATRDWAYNLLMSVEPYGILFTNGDNDTFPLWYVQEVEGIRKDVTVVVGQYLYTSWYPRQLKELTRPRRQRPFREEDSAGIYDVPAEPPANPVITLSEEEVDRVVGGTSSNDLTVPLGPVAVQYPSGTYLDRADQIALAMIYDSIDERPIYFAAPSGLLGHLGLEPWSVRHGLASKLVLRDLEAPQPEGLIRTSDGVGGDWYDVERSIRLWEEVYSFRGFLDRLVWTDRSTLNIPWFMYATTVQLADAVARWEEGTDARLDALQNAAQGLLVTAQGGYLALTEGESEE